MVVKLEIVRVANGVAYSRDGSVFYSDFCAPAYAPFPELLDSTGNVCYFWRDDHLKVLAPVVQHDFFLAVRGCPHHAPFFPQSVFLG